MKVEIIVLLSALASHAAGSPLAARRGGRRGPSRLPFIVRLPQGSTTPRNGFGRLQSRLPFLALPANSHTTTLRAAPPALALAMHAGEPLRLPGLVLFSNTDEQTTQMTSTQRHIERKNDIKRVPRNVFEAYARDQGIPEHGSMERMTTVRHLRSQSLHEYWTSAPDLVGEEPDLNSNSMDYDGQIEVADSDDVQFAEDEALKKSDRNVNAPASTEKPRYNTRKPIDINSEIKTQVKPQAKAGNRLSSSTLDVALAMSKIDTESRFKRFKDDLEAFGHYVATSLRQLSDKNIISAQDEIQAILSKFKARSLKRTVYFDLFS